MWSLTLSWKTFRLGSGGGPQSPFCLLPLKYLETALPMGMLNPWSVFFPWNFWSEIMLSPINLAPVFTPLHLPLFTPDCRPVCWGTTTMRTGRRQAWKLSNWNFFHLPREVSLPFTSQLKFSSQGIHAVNDKRRQNNLAPPTTPSTNNTVMVRDRSSWALMVRVGLWSPISVYAQTIFAFICFEQMHAWVHLRSIVIVFTPAAGWQMTYRVFSVFFFFLVVCSPYLNLHITHGNTCIKTWIALLSFYM